MSNFFFIFNVWYEHYRKPMANDLLMLEISAMPAKIKRATLAQEVVTIRRNISPDLPWDITVKHLNNFCQRMKASGYNESYRYQILKAGMIGYDKMLEVERAGDQSTCRDRGTRTTGKRRKQPKARTGFARAASTSRCLSHAHQEGNWPRG